LRLRLGPELLLLLLELPLLELPQERPPLERELELPLPLLESEWEWLSPLPHRCLPAWVFPVANRLLSARPPVGGKLFHPER
jgi:hypothetical protein